MKKIKIKYNSFMYLVSILLCLTLLSLHFVTGLYAKYVSSDSVLENARVASFYLEAEGPLSRHIQVDLIPGDHIQQTLKVVNSSDVTLHYTLTIINETENLPLEFIFKKDGESEPYEAVHGEYLVEMVLEPGQQTDIYTLDISWPIIQGQHDANIDYMGMLDYLSINIYAIQID